MNKLCRFGECGNRARVGLVLEDETVLDLATAGVERLDSLLEADDLPERLATLRQQNLPRRKLTEVTLLSPVEQQEVWAAGVTYLRSKKARMEESDFSANAYDRVYEAPRPELFFKSLPEKVVGPGQPVGIRKDASWSVPEPELVLVFNSRGRLAGFTAGNDMSSRDIEGENLLYLPQAKIYHRSCAIGPWITVGADEADVRRWKISVEITRGDALAFAGETTIGQMKRSFGELGDYLHRSQVFPYGAALLTGTGVVPPEGFTLRPGDVTRISISGVGILKNPVVEV